MQLPWEPVLNIVCQTYQNTIKKKKKKQAKEQPAGIILLVDMHTLGEPSHGTILNKETVHVEEGRLR